MFVSFKTQWINGENVDPTGLMHESQQEAKVQVKYLDVKNFCYSFNKMHFYLFFKRSDAPKRST